jgi:hypothetical protein
MRIAFDPIVAACFAALILHLPNMGGTPVTRPTRKPTSAGPNAVRPSLASSFTDHA